MGLNARDSRRFISRPAMVKRCAILTKRNPSGMTAIRAPGENIRMVPIAAKTLTADQTDPVTTQA